MSNNCSHGQQSVSRVRFFQEPVLQTIFYEYNSLPFFMWPAPTLPPIILEYTMLMYFIIWRQLNILAQVFYCWDSSLCRFQKDHSTIIFVSCSLNRNIISSLYISGYQQCRSILIFRGKISHLLNSGKIRSLLHTRRGGYILLRQECFSPGSF